MLLTLVILITLTSSVSVPQYFEMKRVSQTIPAGVFEASVIWFLNKEKKIQQNRNSEGLSPLVMRMLLKIAPTPSV